MSNSTPTHPAVPVATNRVVRSNETPPHPTTGESPTVAAAKSWFAAVAQTKPQYPIL